jgi:CRP/FNR family cyclic AMP-dependent transcriptional regulator
MLSPYGLDIIQADFETKRSLCGMSAVAIQTFERIKSRNTYPKDSVLFMEGQASRGVFVLCRGRVKLSLSARDGKTFIFKLAQLGELLGLSATISGKAYELTAETLEPCQVDFVDREDFIRFLRDNPDACLRVSEQLSFKYTNACHELRSLALSRSAGEKLAKLLLHWSYRDGESSNAESSVRLPITQDDIARMVGCCRNTVTRLFADLKRRRIAEWRASTLWVHDKTALEVLAETGFVQVIGTCPATPRLKEHVSVSRRGPGSGRGPMGGAHHAQVRRRAFKLECPIPVLRVGGVTSGCDQRHRHRPASKLALPG